MAPKTAHSVRQTFTINVKIIVQDVFENLSFLKYKKDTATLPN